MKVKRIDKNKRVSLKNIKAISSIVLALKRKIDFRSHCYFDKSLFYIVTTHLSFI